MHLNRFHNEGQLAQLSTWMRPRVKKFKSLNDELPEFRRFLVDIAKDPSLRYVVRAKGLNYYLFFHQ